MLKHTEIRWEGVRFSRDVGRHPLVSGYSTGGSTTDQKRLGEDFHRGYSRYGEDSFPTDNSDASTRYSGCEAAINDVREISGGTGFPVGTRCKGAAVSSNTHKNSVEFPPCCV